MKILFISLGSIGLRHLSNIKRLAPKSEIKILRLKNKFKKKQYNNEKFREGIERFILCENP